MDLLDHPELGFTVTRADGAWDLVVNGAQRLVVRFVKSDYVPVERPVDPRMRSYTLVPDVVLTPYDSAVTVIDLTGSDDVQVARGSEVTDADGTRTATLLFAPGTEAVMTLPDGSETPLSTASVRATELMVGPDGPAAMPAPLPPRTAYTWAAELSADEVIAAGADRVAFDPPVTLYLDNFLDFPSGIVVPAGYYDDRRASWVASDNGHIVAIVSVDGGVAAISLDDDPDTANSTEELAALGITEAEQRALATLYTAGDTLWRVSVGHFSRWDLNWPYGRTGEPLRPPDLPPSRSKDPDEEDECEQGSIVDVHSQTLREEIELTGTPYRLVYASDRVRGRLTGTTLDIPITGPAPPAILQSVTADVEVAGRRFQQSFTAEPDQSWTFTWDGRDAYGRPVVGTAPVVVRIRYSYPMSYIAASPTAQRVFDRLLNEDAAAPEVVALDAVRSEATLDLEREWRLRLAPQGGWPDFALAGWSLDAQRAYDPEVGSAFDGDGALRSGDTVGDTITTVVGGENGYSGDGGPAADAQIYWARGGEVGPDLAYTFADTQNARVRAVSADGVIATVAGNGEQIGFAAGDGGPATEAIIAAPLDVAFGPDGSLFILQLDRVRHVDRDGIISTVVGSAPVAEGLGDGGPAANAVLDEAFRLTFGPDGSLFILEQPHPTSGSMRIRRVGPDGIISTYVGSGSTTPGTDGVPATDLLFNYITDMAVAPDGSLYLSDVDVQMVFRVAPDGLIYTVAGRLRVTGPSGNGGPAIDAALSFPNELEYGPDGSLFVYEGREIRRITPDGLIFPFAGTGNSGLSPDFLPALQSDLQMSFHGAIGPDGSLYLTEQGATVSRIRRIGAPQPPRNGGDYLVATRDGRFVDVFAASGRHVERLHGLTGALVFRPGYDGSGRLVSVTDGSTNVTTVERDADGAPTAIVGPYGARAALTVDTDGYLQTLVDAAGRTWTFEYEPGGLLSRMVDARGGEHLFEYDALRRLTSDEDPAGGSLSFEHFRDDAATTRVVQTSALDRVRERTVVQQGGADRVASNLLPDGTTASRERRADGTRAWTSPDGTVTSMRVGPDPRFGMQVPRVESLTVTTPGGLVLEETSTTTVEGAGGGGPFDFEQLVQEQTINGRLHRTVYDAATRTRTITSPLGRATVEVLDEWGRITSLQHTERAPIVVSYDTRGRLATVSGDATLTLSYDSAGALQTITDPLGRELTITYDSALRPSAIGFVGSTALGLSFDADAHLVTMTPPGGESHGLSYTPVDLLANYSPPAVDDVETPTSYGYNADRQLVSVQRPDARDLTLTYDASGHWSTLAYPDETLTYRYDPGSGLPTGIEGPGSTTVDASWDGVLPTQLLWSGSVAGRVVLTWNDDLQLAGEQVEDLPVVAFGYDDDGLLTSAGSLTITRDADTGFVAGTSIGLVTDATTYDELGQVATYAAAVDGVELYAVEYVHDDLGRITERHEVVSSGTPQVEVFDYDDVGRLVSVEEDGETVVFLSYDDNGNRFDELAAEGESAGTYDAQDRLLTYGAFSYGYSANGELVSRTDTNLGETTTFEYDPRGNLTAAVLSSPDGPRIDYLLDGAWRRLGRAVDGVQQQAWLYRDGYRPVAELDGEGTVVARFVYGTRQHAPDLVLRDGAVYRIVTDHLGSPRFVVDVATGAVVETLDYDAFGRVLLDTNPGFQPFGFAGGLRDADTELVHFGAREYDPEVGRFVSKDPRGPGGGNSNFYLYGGGDPVNTLDPRGQLFNYLRDLAFSALTGSDVSVLTRLGLGELLGLIDDDLGYNPIDTFNDAFDAANRLRPTGEFGTGQNDAMRHCIASCNMTRQFGEGAAELGGYANEVAHPNPPLESAADIWNNSVGQICADYALTDTGCQENCVYALQLRLLSTHWNIGSGYFP